MIMIIMIHYQCDHPCMCLLITRIIILIHQTGHEEEEILDLIIPQHSAQISTGTKLVDMSKQSGRDLNIAGVKKAEEIDLLGAQEALGSADRLLSVRLASDKDKAVEQGLVLISNYRKTPTVSMKLQSGRTGAVPGSGRPVIDENGNITNENHILDLNVDDYKTGKYHFMVYFGFNFLQLFSFIYDHKVTTYWILPFILKPFLLFNHHILI